MSDLPMFQKPFTVRGISLCYPLTTFHKGTFLPTCLNSIYPTDLGKSSISKTNFHASLSSLVLVMTGIRNAKSQDKNPS